MPMPQKHKAHSTPAPLQGRAPQQTIAMSPWHALALTSALLLPSTQLGAATADRNLAVATSPASSATANHQQRVALVIGNGNYKEAPLANPVNDARAMAQALKESGFTVTLQENADMKAMLASVRAFGDQLRKGGVGVFYYAGHGMQIKGRNYLIPVASTIEREDEVAYSAVDAQAVLDKMDAAGNGTNIMILDACRNNPFNRSFRSGQQGLAQMDAPVGTLVAFATAPGSVASDGGNHNGLYTQHLLSAMREPGSKVEDVFKKVRSAVRRDSQGKQVPWESTSLEGDFYFRAPVSVEPIEVTLERTMWGLVKDSQQAVELKAYLQRFPKGANAAQAAARLAQLESRPANTTANSTANSTSRPAASNAGTPANPAPQVASNQADDELAAWQKLQNSRNPEQYRAFLQRFPNRKFSVEAVNKIMELEEEAASLSAGAAQTVAAASPMRPANASTAATNKPTQANRWGIHLGDRWNVQVVDKYKGEVVSNFSRKVEQFFDNGDWRSGTTRFSPEGNIRSYSNNRFSNRTYTESAVWVPQVLKAGHKENFQYLEKSQPTDGSSFTQEWKGTMTVKGKETIVVPAGKFEAWRIVREADVTGTPGNGGPKWLARNEVTLWFVPEIHHWVAWEESHRRGSNPPDLVRNELTSYEVREPQLAAAFQ